MDKCIYAITFYRHMRIDASHTFVRGGGHDTRTLQHGAWCEAQWHPRGGKNNSINETIRRAAEKIIGEIVKMHCVKKNLRDIAYVISNVQTCKSCILYINYKYHCLYIHMHELCLPYYFEKCARGACNDHLTLISRGFFSKIVLLQYKLYIYSFTCHFLYRNTISLIFTSSITIGRTKVR